MSIIHKYGFGYIMTGYCVRNKGTTKVCNIADSEFRNTSTSPNT